MPSAADIVRCERCRAQIVWTITAKGQRMAINAKPDDTGNQAVYADGVGRLRSRGLSTDRPTLEGAEWRGMPHVVTCIVPAPRRPRGAPRAVRRTPPWWRSR